MAEEETFSWDERRCPVYSLQPLRLFGLSMETAAIAIVLIGLFKPFVGMAWATLIAFVVGYVYEKASEGRMPNFVPFWVSDVVTSDVVRRWFPGLESLVTKPWRAAGLPPAPGHSRRYEP